MGSLPPRVLPADTRGERVGRSRPCRLRRFDAGVWVSGAFLAPHPAMVDTHVSTFRGDGDAPSGDAEEIAVTPKVADGDVVVRIRQSLSVDVEAHREREFVDANADVRGAHLS